MDGAEREPRRSVPQRAGIAVLMSVALVIGAASCQAPTQVSLLLRSDMPCGVPSGEGYGVREVHIYAGPNEEAVKKQIAEGVPDAIVTSCKGPGQLGTLTLFREASDKAYVKVIASLEQRRADGSKAPPRNATDCPSEGGNEQKAARCLVATRRFDYARNATKFLPLTLQESCVPKWWECAEGKTCINRACVPDDIPLSDEAPPYTPDTPGGRTDGGGPQPSDSGPADSGAAHYPVDISLGGSHSCALYDNGSVRCWGANNFGQLGQGNTIDIGLTESSMLSLKAIPLPDAAVAISAGGSRTCAVLKNQRVVCWGYDGDGATGGILGYSESSFAHRGDTPGETSVLPGVPIGGDAEHVSVSMGQHTCAWNGPKKAAWCWGVNQVGQLGLGDMVSRLGVPGIGNVALALDSTVTLTQISTGALHTCAIFDARVYCWGMNSGDHIGVLGTGMNGNETQPVLAALPGNPTALQVAAGSVHTCALLQPFNGVLKQIKCWGTNDFGQLGTDTATYYGGVPGIYGSYAVAAMATLPSVSLSAGNPEPDLIAAGAFHTCARLKRNAKELVCWGRNVSGQLGDNAEVDRGGGTGLFAVQNKPPLSFPANVEKIAAGGETPTTGHTCVLLADHSIWCWGSNNHGQLGYPLPVGTSHSNKPGKVTAPKL